MMATVSIPASQLRCTHDGIHGPDSEPGAVQRCMEETIGLRVDHSAIGQKVARILQETIDELIPELVNRAIRETWALEDGSLGHEPVLDPPDRYGRSQPFVAEWGKD
jgi:hypothetical protein